MSNPFGAPRARDPASTDRGLTPDPRAEPLGAHPAHYRVAKLHLGPATLLALVALAIAIGTALGVISVVGTLLHTISPDRQFDTYAALHNEAVVFTLIGLSVLWLLPPHPWAKELVEVCVRDDPEARYPSPVTGKPRLAVVSVYQCRAPPQRRAAA